MAVHLPPSPYPLGVFQPFIAQQPEALVLKEKVMSLSGDSFSVKTADGRAILEVKGETFTLSGRKVVKDMQGNHLFSIRKHKLGIHKSFYAEDPQGKRFFELKGKFGLLSSKSIGYFTNTCTPQPQEEELLIKGNFFDSSADITDSRTGQPIARIDRKFLNGRELFANQQTYLVSIAPGVDMSIIVAMCICLDERKNEG